MKSPTPQELDRAAQTLAAIARIDSLQGGVVHFAAERLAGGWWHPEEDEVPWPGTYIWAVVPPADDGDLEATARRYIQHGIEYRQSCLEEFVHALTPPRDVRDRDKLAEIEQAQYEKGLE